MVRFSPEQLYAVVAQVDTYKEFVPWCQRSVVTKVHSEERLDAELEVGFKLFVERYGACSILLPNFCILVLANWCSHKPLAAMPAAHAPLLLRAQDWSMLQVHI